MKMTMKKVQMMTVLVRSEDCFFILVRNFK